MSNTALADPRRFTGAKASDALRIPDAARAVAETALRPRRALYASAPMDLTLLATGGTIASTRGSDGRITASLSGGELLAGLPLGGDSRTAPHVPAVRVRPVDLSVPGSWNLTSPLALEIVRAGLDAADAGTDGIVVTHGTDVLEETAWLFELLVRPRHPELPVVFTAAMRHADEFAGDGPRNLLDAVAVAAEPSSRGRGALVCVNGELHHARHVVKTHATAVSTFASPDHGPVGEVGEFGVRFLAPSPAAPPLRPVELATPVAVVLSHWDADGSVVDHHLERGARAVVVEGSGAGNVHGPLADGLHRALAAGVPVVVTTRCRHGRVTPIYGGPGGGAMLAASGAVMAPGLPTGKARLAVQVAIGGDGADPAALVSEYFAALDDLA